eukprot:TRINITY_DN10895_c0_g1_i1.p1 TRINITY_DN10895_c0_g1~~TRINITY_DN10895_c0_g1_i1.p1  ORF type:complete len:515 (-),score=173.42 TRINITY_DN10895_c0_g1_i1:239-1711(-)
MAVKRAAEEAGLEAVDAAAVAAKAEGALLEEGAKVAIKGLQAKPEDNGKKGEVLTYFADVGKYRLLLEDGRTVKVKRENIDVLSTAAKKAKPEVKAAAATKKAADAPSAAADAAAAEPKAFQPAGKALLDPQAYLAQWSKHAATSGQVTVPGVPTPAVASTAKVAAKEVAPEDVGKTDIQIEVEKASAVKCASIVKDKGANFTNAVAIAALSTMAEKSSYKLREEILKQPHVKRLAQRIREILQRPPPGLSLDLLAQAAWSLTRFPAEVMGDNAGWVLGGCANALSSSPSWTVEQAVKILWALGKADVVGNHKPLVSAVVAELIRDQGRRLGHLSDEHLVNLLHCIALSRRHLKKGDLQTIHVEANDAELFRLASERVCRDVEKIEVRLLADVIHTHNEIGLKDEKLFKVLCPRIVKNEKELNTKSMGNCIKAYARFMIPLREEQQGFRTMAIVSKGDFIRPSEKPQHRGPKTFDKPQALYDKTQVHARG